VDPSHPSPGAIIGGKYRIERVLGEGGMGAVYEAVHTRLDQRVAIKMLLPELVKVGELVWRFEREAKAAAQLRHRNTARVVDVDATAEGVPYMVMELLHGHDLESELQSVGQLPVDQAVHYVLQACSAMGEAHSLGIVHRDLKPANLFLNDEADGSVCLKVLDFGISKVKSDADVRVTTTKAQMGTPLYMSPEQVRSAKNVDLRTDIWSLGVILYELLAGEPPFTGSAAGIGAAIVNDAPRPLRELRPEVPEALEAAVSKAMQKNPADRFASTLELSAALAPFSSVPVLSGALSRPRVASVPGISSPSSRSIAVAATVAVPTPTDASKGVSGAGATAGTWAEETKPSARPRRLWIVGAVAGLAAVAIVGAVGFSLSHTPATATGTPALPSALAPATATPAVSAPLASAAVTPPTLSATTLASAATVAPPKSATPQARPSAAAKPTATHSASPANPERL
jgi:serine/threonine-protein kinase